MPSVAEAFLNCPAGVAWEATVRAALEGRPFKAALSIDRFSIRNWHRAAELVTALRAPLMALLLERPDVFSDLLCKHDLLVISYIKKSNSSENLSVWWISMEHAPWRALL